MASDDLSDRLPAYVRLLLLILGEAIAGVFLYALFSFMPMAEILIIVVAGVIIANNNFNPSKNKSLASLLCGITAAFTVVCNVVARLSHRGTAHEDMWLRLSLVGAGLMATLIFLDRREGA